MQLYFAVQAAADAQADTGPWLPAWHSCSTNRTHAHTQQASLSMKYTVYSNLQRLSQELGACAHPQVTQLGLCHDLPLQALSPPLLLSFGSHILQCTTHARRQATACAGALGLMAKKLEYVQG
jgi:hypothetical protein